MAILEVKNISGNNWGGSKVRVNNGENIILPPSARLDLRRFGHKVNIRVDEILLRMNGSTDFKIERGDVITAVHLSKGNFQVTHTKSEKK